MQPNLYVLSLRNRYRLDDHGLPVGWFWLEGNGLPLDKFDLEGCVFSRLGLLWLEGHGLPLHWVLARRDMTRSWNYFG